MNLLDAIFAAGPMTSEIKNRLAQKGYVNSRMLPLMKVQKSGWIMLPKITSMKLSTWSSANKRSSEYRNKKVKTIKHIIDDWKEFA